jgi:hypothetical protein
MLCDCSSSRIVSLLPSGAACSRAGGCAAASGEAALWGAASSARCLAGRPPDAKLPGCPRWPLKLAALCGSSFSRRGSAPDASVPSPRPERAPGSDSTHTLSAAPLHRKVAQEQKQQGTRAPTAVAPGPLAPLTSRLCAEACAVLACCKHWLIRLGGTSGNVRQPSERRRSQAGVAAPRMQQAALGRLSAPAVGSQRPNRELGMRLFV